jgi:hypothetical protein
MPAATRRDVLRGLTGALASPLLLTRADCQVTPELVQFRPEIEPLVALLERTPREKCAEMLVGELKRGVSYRQALAALFLAGVRNINPRPPGFAMHCVFVVHSANLIALEAPPESRLLPLFYVLDDFKASQDRDAHSAGGDYTMYALRGPLPSAEKAPAEFAAAMEAWDMERAERAIVALARTRGAAEIFPHLWRYGARDYRNIGHKAIYVANAYRTLQTIGWQHAEPVLRSLVLALLDFGKEQSVTGYALNDQVFAGNVQRAHETFARLGPDWASGTGDSAATLGMLKTMRSGAPADASAECATRMVRGASAQAMWDAVHLAGAELRMRARGGASIASIHAVTAANGLHYAYLTASDPQLRYLLLLQAIGWMGQFRTFAGARAENLRAAELTSLEPASGDPMAELKSNPDGAASRVMKIASDPQARQAFLTTALRHTIAKVDEVHYYKYLAALMEDVPLASPEWQSRLFASSVYYMKGPADEESAPMKRAREALKAL